MLNAFYISMNFNLVNSLPPLLNDKNATTFLSEYQLYSLFIWNWMCKQFGNLTNVFYNFLYYKHIVIERHSFINIALIPEFEMNRKINTEAGNFVVRKCLYRMSSSCCCTVHTALYCTRSVFSQKDSRFQQHLEQWIFFTDF